MYHKLNEEALNLLLENGIREFADKGFDNAKISDIAGKSGLSVGVLYKYFQGKDDFFLQCVRHSLEPLGVLMGEIEINESSLEGNLERVLRVLFDYSREHSDYFILYHEITGGSCRKFAGQLAQEIEQVTADVYRRLFQEAMEQGIVRQDIDPSIFAFFFDNLLMMQHFSLSCDYYRKRLKIYCQQEPDEELLIRELLKFVTGALGMKTGGEQQ